MTKDQKRFLRFAAITLIVAISVSQILFSTILKAFGFPAHTASIVFVWAVTFTFHYWLMKTVTDNPKAFVRVFMLQLFGKMALFATYAVVVAVIFYKQQILPFILHFFVVYLFFAIFDVSLILKFVKEKSEQTPDSVEKSN